MNACPAGWGRSDMCQTGKYRERGIRGLDGYQTEYVVDKEDYVVRVAPELEAIGVLLEPLSIVEKAIDEALRVQIARSPEAAVTPDWLFGRRCLVAGLGPVGLAGCDGPHLCEAAMFTDWTWLIPRAHVQNG